MLTCNKSNVLSINLGLNVDAPHSFQISCLSDTASNQLGQDIIIYRDGTAILKGVVTSYSYDPATKVLSLSGTDNTSEKYSNDASSHTNISLPTSTVTNLATAINTVTSGAASACPSITCNGFGSFSGTTKSFIDRICNSFGLNAIADPLASSGQGSYALTAGDNTTPNNPNLSPALNCTKGQSKDRQISQVFIQRPITQGSSTSITIQNAGSQETTTLPLVNPNAVESGYPADCWIDPWTRALVKINVPVATTIYSTATNISPAKQITVVSCSDSAAQPAWYLQLYAADPGTHDHPTGASLIATLSPGQTWQDNNQTVSYVRIARTLIYETGGATTTSIEFPHYDGVNMQVLTWAEPLLSQEEAWSDTYNSTEQGGRPDYNIISDEMYPAHSTFNSQHLGAQIANRDSINQDISISIPGTPSIPLKSGQGSTIEGTTYALPVMAVQYSYAPGQEQTTIQGDW